MKKFGFPLLLIGIVGVMVAIFVAGNGGKSSSTNPSGPLLGDKHANQGQQHIQPGTQHVAYNSNPPSSGPHYLSPTPWGIKDSQIADETLVHNEEHGGVIIAYKPDLPKDQVDLLKQIFQSLPASSQFNEVKAVLVPRAANDHAIELAAWTYTYNLDSVDGTKIKQFYQDHLDKGPELVP